MPGITHWQSPRYFAYFATTAAEPGILAELLIAGLNQVGILWRASPALQELEEVTLDWLRQLLGLPEPLHGHIEDTASSGLITALAAARAAAPDRRVVVCSEHTHSSTVKAARLLELEIRHGAGRRRLRDPAGHPRPTRRLRRRRHRGHDLVRRGRPGRSDRRPRRRRAGMAPRRRGVRGLGGRLPRAAAPLRRLGAGRLDRRQPAQVAVHADGLLRVLLPPPGRPPARVQPRARVPARQTRTSSASASTPRRSAGASAR